MKKAILAVPCGLLAILILGTSTPRLVSGQTESITGKLVTAMRVLNTEEYSYRGKTGRFASREEMLVFLRNNGSLSKSPIDLENPTPYELAVTTTLDGAHYQIALRRPSDMNDKSTWCQTAAFSDDRGVIFLGLALGCEEMNKKQQN
jgi:hypothetical protein